MDFKPEYEDAKPTTDDGDDANDAKSTSEIIVVVERDEMAKIGRPTTYTEERGREVCEMVAEGRTLAQICKRVGIGGISTIFNWERDTPAFAKLYAHARINSADSYAQEAITEVRGAYDAETANIARVRSQVLMWMAGRMNPRRYGETQHHDVNVGVEHTKRVIIEHRHVLPKVEKGGQGKSAGLKRSISMNEGDK